MKAPSTASPTTPRAARAGETPLGPEVGEHGLGERDQPEPGEDEGPAARDEEERRAERTEDSRDVSHACANSNALGARPVAARP